MAEAVVLLALGESYPRCLFPKDLVEYVLGELEGGRCGRNKECWVAHAESGAFSQGHVLGVHSSQSMSNGRDIK